MYFLTQYSFTKVSLPGVLSKEDPPSKDLQARAVDYNDVIIANPMNSTLPLFIGQRERHSTIPRDFCTANNSCA